MMVTQEGQVHGNHFRRVGITWPVGMSEFDTEGLDPVRS